MKKNLLVIDFLWLDKVYPASKDFPSNFNELLHTLEITPTICNLESLSQVYIKEHIQNPTDENFQLAWETTCNELRIALEFYKLRGKLHEV